MTTAGLATRATTSSDDVFLTPSGGQAARCKARAKRTGRRCTQPARTGFAVCKVHGAGARKREDAGTKTPVRLGAFRHGVRAGGRALDDFARVEPRFDAHREEVRANPARLRNYDELLALLWALADFAPGYVDHRTVPPLLAVLERLRRALATDARIRALSEAAIRVPVFQEYMRQLLDLVLRYVPDEQRDEFLDRLNAFAPVVEHGAGHEGVVKRGA